MNSRLLGAICAFVLTLSTTLTCSPTVWADIEDCNDQLHAVQDALHFRPPVDPAVMHQVLDLMHEGEILCMESNVSDGLARINQALTLVSPIVRRSEAAGF